MSISGISSGPAVYQKYAPSPFQKVRKDFAALKTSLTSGDLKGAQVAFKTLTQDLQAMGQAQNSQQTGGSSPLDNDLVAISTALQKGDLQGAQNAFATLTQDMQQMWQTQGGQQTQKVHHHHHHHGGSAQNTQNTTSNPFSDLAAISSALQSGDVSGAQKAFTTLQQDLGNSSSTQTTAATSGTDLTALGSALQSGDLNQAQNAFATLMQDLQNSIATLGSGASQAVGTVVNLTA
jgi:DNA-binding FadR family transcriptional regulator